MRGLYRFLFVAALFATFTITAAAQGRTTRLSKKCVGSTSSSVIELSTYGNPSIRGCAGVNGGEVRLQAGNADATSVDVTGGSVVILTGTGGVGTALTANTGGDGGTITINPGAGGASTVAASTISGNGGPITLTSGAGGNRTGATGTAGSGGTIGLYAGVGGTGSGGASNGLDGLIYLGSPSRNQRLILDASVELNRTVTAAGTTGARTINKAAGTVNFAAAATSLVVTNSLVNTSSIIFTMIRTADTTCTFVKSVVPAAGSFTITLNAGCAAETSVGFFVTN